MILVMPIYILEHTAILDMKLHFRNSEIVVILADFITIIHYRIVLYVTIFFNVISQKSLR